MGHPVDNSATKDIRKHFRLNKENDATKDKIIGNIKTLFEQEDYYKRIRNTIFLEQQLKGV